MAADPAEMQLINKAKSGDNESFELLIEGCKTKAYNTALHYLKNEEDALDVLQESLIKVFRHMDKFKGECKFDTWVYRIVVNSCKDFLRKNSQNMTESIYQKTQDAEMMLDFPDGKSSPSELLEKEETTAIILSCLYRMPEDQRAVIILRDIQGFSYEEIGKILDCTIGTVKSRINRARLKLREYILEQKESLFV